MNMPNRHRGEGKDAYITCLENEVMYFTDKVGVLKQELRELAAKGPGRRSSNADH